MAKTVVDLSGLPRIERPGRIAILQSKWYPEIVTSMSTRKPSSTNEPPA